MKALVVDDSRTIRKVVARIVGGLGFSVCEAGDGQEALDRIGDAAPFDVVLVDWNMPVMDGLEFVKRVRADDSLAAMPVVMVTTESQLTSIVDALDAGATDYLVKPFTAQALQEKLAAIGVA